MKSAVVERLTKEFGAPSREVVKVKSWDLPSQVGVVAQIDQPTREHAAYVWLRYPGEGQPVPENALEYPGEAGRHSGTYPAAGLKRGEPALKLTIRNLRELDDVVDYIRAMSSNTTLVVVEIEVIHGHWCLPTSVSVVLQLQANRQEQLIMTDRAETCPVG
jgi:hypothetical protein